MDKNNKIEEENNFPFDSDIFPSNDKNIIHGKPIDQIKKASLEQKKKRRKKTRVNAKEKRVLLSNQHKENTFELSQEDKLIYYSNLKANKKNLEESLSNAIYSPIKVVFDLDFLMYMKDQEIKSLAHQLTYAYRVNKENKTKICFYLASFTDQIKEELEKMGSSHWHCKFYHEEFYKVEELIGLGRNFVYLSPDSEEDLDTIDENCVYVIGGLVDKPVIKNRSLLKVQQIVNDDEIIKHKDIVITTKRLPLRKYVDNIRNPVLNINTVVEIISKFIDTNDWKNAIISSLPMRMKNNANDNNI